MAENYQEIQVNLLRRVVSLLQQQKKESQSAARGARAQATIGTEQGSTRPRSGIEQSPRPVGTPGKAKGPSSIASFANVAGEIGRAIQGAIQAQIKTGQAVERSASGFESDESVAVRRQVRGRIAREQSIGENAERLLALQFGQLTEGITKLEREFNKANDPFQRTQQGVRSRVGGAISEFTRAGGTLGQEDINALIEAVLPREQEATKGLKLLEQALSKRNEEFLRSEPSVQAIIGRK